MAVLGVGIDLIEVDDAARLLERWGDRILKRLLTDAERAYVIRFASPAKHFAARLAAKEAVYKALQSLPGTREVSWKEIEVERDEVGRPSVRLHGAALRAAESNGLIRVALSLTHTERTAGAVAVLET